MFKKNSHDGSHGQAADNTKKAHVESKRRHRSSGRRYSAGGTSTAGHGGAARQGDITSEGGVAVAELTRTFKIPGRREKVEALAGVNLELRPGSFTSIVGASGSGKSTLMLCVAGLDQPTSGTVNMLGVETSGLGRRERATFRAENVGFIFQDGNLVSSLSARDNIALPGQLRHKPLARSAVNEALERVGLSGQARRMPSALSGGERQRVAVARVLASKPAVIFADEPTAALDVGAGEQVLGWLREAANGGSSVLMVTHDAQAAARADRVLVMNAGRIARELPGGDP
ncbi:MAG: ABC transporter ATP-binding protein [Ancrocorticia sp.]